MFWTNPEFWKWCNTISRITGLLSFAGDNTHACLLGLLSHSPCQSHRHPRSLPSSKEMWEGYRNLEIRGGSWVKGRGACHWAPASPHCCGGGLDPSCYCCLPALPGCLLASGFGPRCPEQGAASVASGSAHRPGLRTGSFSGRAGFSPCLTTAHLDLFFPCHRWVNHPVPPPAAGRGPG